MSWVEGKIGDFVEIKHGFAFKSEFFTDEGELVVLTPGNCHERGGFRSKGEKEKFYRGPVPDGYLLEEGELVVVMTDLVSTAPVLGGAFTIPEGNRFLHNQRLGLIEVTDPSRIDKRFLYHLLNTNGYRAQVRGSATGATVRHTAPGRIKECRVRYPRDIRVQAKVADILSAYDDLIENNRRRIALLEEAARLLYREWFVHFRFPGHEHVPLIDGLPEGWERQAASAVMDVLSGGTPKTGNATFWDGDIGFFTPKDATDTPYVLTTEKTITEEGLRACNSKLYPTDTLFITARGTVGKLNLALVPMAMNQSCYALRSKSRFGQRYLYVALKAAIEQVRSRATGAVFDAIIVATFDRIPFLVPPANLTRSFEQSIDPMFDQIANLIQQNQKLARARDLLLPRLMNGEIAV